MSDVNKADLVARIILILNQNCADPDDAGEHQ
jgi:hypothetical protein